MWYHPNYHQEIHHGQEGLGIGGVVMCDYPDWLTDAMSMGFKIPDGDARIAWSNYGTIRCYPSQKVWCYGYGWDGYTAYNEAHCREHFEDFQWYDAHNNPLEVY